MALLYYLKNIFVLLLGSIGIILIYPLFAENHPIELHYNSAIIYTTQNALILIMGVFSILFIFFMKFLYLTITTGFFIKIAYTKIKNFILKIFKRPINIVKEINKLKRQKKYKQALKITESNYKNSNEVLFQHFFLLLKLKKRFKFFRTFQKYQCGKAIPLFISATKTWSKFRTNLYLLFLYRKNTNNDVITYIYIRNLIKNNKHKEAYSITKDFLQNKFIFFKEQYTFYLFNKIALELELIESEGSTDFATTYIENIQKYHYASSLYKKES